MNLAKTILLSALASSIGLSAGLSPVSALNASEANNSAVKTTAPKTDKLAMAYQISKPYSAGNLTLYLVKGVDKSQYKQILTLPEGIAQKRVVVRETGDVNTLKIDNLSKTALFIQSGEIVKGGQQDRALQSDMLIPPNSKNISLPCFCVEHGRWSGRVGESDSRFGSANNFVVGNAINGSIRKDGDQQKVWDQVQKKQDQLGSKLAKPVSAPASPSSLQLTLEHKSVKDAVNTQLKALSAIPNNEKDAIGYAVAINGKISNADIYASGALFKKLWPGLLKAAVTEAVAQRGQANEKRPSPHPSPAQVRTVLAGAEKFKAVASASSSLQGATNGTIGPQGQDATFVTGVNTAGTVRAVNTNPFQSFFKTIDSKSGYTIHENFLGK